MNHFGTASKWYSKALLAASALYNCPYTERKRTVIAWGRTVGGVL